MKKTIYSNCRSFRFSLFVLLLSAALGLSFASLAFADEWIQENGKWKFQYDDGSFETRGWKWIDSDRDCITECYYFHEDGTLEVNGTAPDGSTVDRNGAWTENRKVQTRPTQVSIIVTGDNLIHKQLIDYGQAVGDYYFLYDQELSNKLNTVDLAVLSQETIFVEDPAQYSGFPSFGTPLAVGEAAINAGFNFAACATNHSMDKGLAGINATASFWESKGIPYIGIQPTSQPDYIPYKLLTVNGVRLAMYDYSYGTNGISIPSSHPNAVHLLTSFDRVRSELALGRAAADAVIVFVHWGSEYQADPNGFQRNWANLFLESGVDVVVGTHPHVLQPVEEREREDGHRMLLYYSLGNMVSRQDRHESSIGGMAEFTITRTPEKTTFTEYELKPLVTHQTEVFSTAILLEDYTPELAAAHRMGLSLPQWTELAAAWTKGTGAYWCDTSVSTKSKLADVAKAEENQAADANAKLGKTAEEAQNTLETEETQAEETTQSTSEAEDVQTEETAQSSSESDESETANKELNENGYVVAHVFY